ncbi:hypothetical protein [Streptomyces sp. MST-110588]|uniref:hypothetical protein n=1 Tax=Streptomyces sp. MST-110588 TaxID=2833628 RepID=UPI001F5CDC5A|nr:hypothetical protein [Streptomyces sp. MST-110588]UNO39822.1 hypothetical protein KGS77_09745 [Streptomyces sp. MST-110588]
MEAAVQWVRTTWTKKSRGGEAATRRNAAPVGFALPYERASFPCEQAPSPYERAPFAHVVRMHERDGFAPYDSREELSKVAVQLREADGRLRVLPQVWSRYALPARRRRPPTVRLVPGQWVRWQLNYRFSSAMGIRGWTYWLDTFNIAYGPVDADAFLSAPPVFIDERGYLR